MYSKDKTSMYKIYPKYIYIHNIHTPKVHVLVDIVDMTFSFLYPSPNGSFGAQKQTLLEGLDHAPRVRRRLLSSLELTTLEGDFRAVLLIFEGISVEKKM